LGVARYTFDKYNAEVMKTLTQRLSEVEDNGFASLAWMAKIQIERLEDEVEILKNIIYTNPETKHQLDVYYQGEKQ